MNNEQIHFRFNDKFIIFHSFHRIHSQLTDWLNLDQKMAKNYHVDVSDIDAITEAINKQKVTNHLFLISFASNFFFSVENNRIFWLNQSVVRELESKKPQLDDLILLAETLKTDGNRQKLHNKGKLSVLLS